ncbi:MAG TPA: hypothetical protein VH395_12610 [Jatrophihabitantaceae bacterium]|jgi:hypothetical protein
MEPAARRDERYAIRVRTAVGPAVRQYVAPGCRCSARACDVVVRFRVADTADLIALYDRLLASGVEVVAMRRVD